MKHIFEAAGWAAISVRNASHGLAQPRLAGRRVLGLLDHRDRRLDQRLDGGQEALLLVLEVLVEGAARDAGELDQVGDLGRLVALLGDCRDHRPEEPLALAAVGLLARLAAAGAHHSRPQLVASPHGVRTIAAHHSRVCGCSSAPITNLELMVRN